MKRNECTLHFVFVVTNVKNNVFIDIGIFRGWTLRFVNNTDAKITVNVNDGNTNVTREINKETTGINAMKLNKNLK